MQLTLTVSESPLLSKESLLAFAEKAKGQNLTPDQLLAKLIVKESTAKKRNEKGDKGK